MIFVLTFGWSWPGEKTVSRKSRKKLYGERKSSPEVLPLDIREQ